MVTKKKYRVRLRSVGNPDFGQDPARPLRAGMSVTATVEVGNTPARG